VFLVLSGDKLIIIWMAFALNSRLFLFRLSGASVGHMSTGVLVHYLLANKPASTLL